MKKWILGHVDDKLPHLIVVSKMKGTVKEWYHSKVEHVEMSWSQLLHFNSRPSGFI